MADFPERDRSGDDMAAGATVLIVDDVPENLMVLGELLRGEGYTLRAARSGTAALSYAAMEPLPDLILLDVMMPGMDGYEVFRKLRENEATAAIPVIFLTALSQAQNVAYGLHLGAADYIVKPIQPEVVLARVRSQLEAKRARDWLKDQNAFLEAEVARRMAENRRIQDENEQAQARLNHQREMILAAAAEGIFGVDGDGVINFANPAANALLGYGSNDLSGRQIQTVLFPEAMDDGRHGSEGFSIRAAYRDGVMVEGKETIFWRRDGSPLSVEYSCTPIVEEGKLAGAVITLQDISERKRYLEQLEHKSNYDDLTQLPNRNLLNDRLSHAFERCLVDGSTVAVLVLNLDRFKGINDSLGHDAGDQILRDAANRLRKVLGNQHTLARIEGDEFVLVVEDTDSESAALLGKQMLQALVDPFRVDGRELFLTGSMGIAFSPRDGDSGDVLLKNAMAAMYKAKGVGGDRFHFYSAEMNARLLERLELENGLRRAIDNDELVVHYQPQLSLRTGEIIGAEALVRWQHPERGLIMPGEFISLAENCGLIIPLGEWVLRTACRQNKAWQDMGLRGLKVAVNLSARQFAAQDVVHLAGDILAETGLAPNYLELELTESAVMADAEAFVHATERLKGLCVTLTIDDFGTGFSSLNYLKRFSVDRLKIDQSFVQDVTHDANSAAIALAIISLAHNLKMLAIAEGVETEAQLNFLRMRDCDEMQGFYFSKAVPAEEFETILRQCRKLEFSPASTLPQRTLLLVDDEPGVLSSLKRLFRREGYNILTAENGMEGLNLLATHDVGVVISDARMPEMSGAEFLGKARDIYPDIMRIMLSGYTDLKAVTSAVNRGELFSFLTKPWDDDELLVIVRDAFHQHELRHSASREEQ